MSDELQFPATDGYQLGGALFEPSGPVRGAVVIASAMAVRQKLYKYFARFLASQGLATLTFDYRGIDRSLHGSLKSMREATVTGWAQHDLTAALRLMRAKYPDVPQLHVGHSIGGQILGLTTEPVDASLLIAAQSGYWRHWSGWPRAGMWLYWQLMPGLSRVTGYLPMQALRQGENVPLGAALEWGAWGKRPEYVLSSPLARHADRQIPMRAYGFTDDFYAPPAAIDALLKMYAHCRTERLEVTPAQLSVQSIGHFGIFARQFEPTFWSEAAQWLLARAGEAR